MEDIQNESLDIIDFLRLIQRRQGKFVSLLMQDLEEEFQNQGYDTNIKAGTASPFYAICRKLVLDYINDYSRSIMRTLVGESVEPDLYDQTNRLIDRTLTNRE